VRSCQQKVGSKRPFSATFDVSIAPVTPELRSEENLVYTRRIMLIRVAFVTALLCACYAADRTAIPSGSKVFVEPKDGFDIYLIKALGKNQVPLTIVFDDEETDFIITSMTSEPDEDGKPVYYAKIEITKITKTKNFEEWKATTLANYEADKKALLAKKHDTEREIYKDPSNPLPQTVPWDWRFSPDAREKFIDLGFKINYVKWLTPQGVNFIREHLTELSGPGPHGYRPENRWTRRNLPPFTSAVIYTDETPDIDAFTDWQSVADHFANRLKQAMNP
jgi:hypothetical protein